MALPNVGIKLHSPGDAPAVYVSGVLVPGVRSVQVTAAQDRLPQVVLALVAETVDVELPAGVTVVQACGGAAGFAAALNPARLQTLALEHLDRDPDCTHGEAYAAAVAALAGEHDDRG